MNDEPLEIVRGSGNVYRDFGQPNAGLEQARRLSENMILERVAPDGLQKNF